MFKDVLIEQNIHWFGELYDAGIERDYFSQILRYMSTGMILSIMGVRRAGKSTLLRQTINYLITHEKVPPKNILFLNLEHPYFAAFSKEVGYLQKIYEEYIKLHHPDGKIYILLDEIQFFNEWPIFVKSHYERKRVQFLLTGSNSALLSADFITALSGRTLSIEVFPLSFQEVAKARAIDITSPLNISKNRLKLLSLIDQFIKFGGFPEVALHLNPTVAYDILNEYVKTIIYQDVAPRLQIRKSVELERLFVYLISNVGKPFSYKNLSELFDLSDKIIKEYIGAFSDSYLLFELEEFNFSLKKQIRQPKKIYSIDPGQVNAVAFLFLSNFGRLLENLVFLELRRLGLEIYYYKTQNKLEVDFVAKQRLRMSLVQVSWNIDAEDTYKCEKTALLEALEELKLPRGLILTEDRQEELVEDGKILVILPAYMFFCLSPAQKLQLLQLG